MSFHPTSDTWIRLAPTLYSRRGGASFVLQGCLYVAGGPRSRCSRMERYDVASDTWTVVADMHKNRCAFGAFTIGPAGPAEEQDRFYSLIAKAATVYDAESNPGLTCTAHYSINKVSHQVCGVSKGVRQGWHRHQNYNSETNQRLYTAADMAQRFSSSCTLVDRLPPGCKKRCSSPSCSDAAGAPEVRRVY
jgi:hypothetical protein